MKKEQISLLNVRDVMRLLGLNRNDRAWRQIRKQLIIGYGMSRVGGAGYRIPLQNLERFIRETFC